MKKQINYNWSFKGGIIVVPHDCVMIINKEFEISENELLNLISNYVDNVNLNFDVTQIEKELLEYGFDNNELTLMSLRDKKTNLLRNAAESIYYSNNLGDE